MRDEAELIISCQNTGSPEVDRFTESVLKADNASNQLIQTAARLFSTAAMVQFGRTAIGTFSDLQESTQKFYEVFKGYEGVADAAAKKLEESFGASQRSAKSMLSLTGDLLTGFGFAKDESLKLSEQVAQLGSDIASFANYAGGAEGATIAITKAMLGETEMAKMLGIAIKTDSKEFKELMENIKKTRHVTDAQAKALAALQTAFEQKKTAMGDFERNINSIANRGRILSNELEDLKSNVGRGLAESFSGAQAAGIQLLKLFNDLDPETQNFITKTGAIATGLFAVKTAFAVNNAMQAIAGRQTAQNTAHILAEAEAHTRNAAAIQTENNVRKAGQFSSVIDIGKQIKTNINSGNLARHDLDLAKSSGASSAEIKKLQNNYKTILQARRQLYAMRDMELMNLQIQKANSRFENFNKQITTMQGNLKFPLSFVAGANKIQAGLVGVGIAANSAAASVAKFSKIQNTFPTFVAGVNYATNAVEALGNTSTKTAASVAKFSRIQNTFPTFVSGANKIQAGLVGVGIAANSAAASVAKFSRIQNTFPTFVSGANKIQAGLVGVGIAAKSVAVAVGSIAKAALPMLAISAGLAALDYFMGRGKREAQEKNEIAAMQYRDTQAKVVAIKQEISAENELISTLQTLQKYSFLTNEEQETARDIVGKLSQKYGDLSDSIKVVNDRLVIAKDLTKKMSEEQIKAYIQAEKRSARSAKERSGALYQGFQKEFALKWWEKKNLDTFLLDTIFGTKIMEGIGNKETVLELAWRGGDAKKFEQIANFAAANNLKEMAERAKQIAQALRDADNHNKNIAEAEKALASGKPLVPGGGNPVVKTTAEIEKDFAKAKNAFADARKTMEFSMLSPMEKIAALEKEIAEKQKALNNAVERGGNSREKQTEAYKIAKDILAIEEQRGRIKGEIAAENVRKLEEEARIQQQFLSGLTSAYGRYRETTQQAISAESSEAIRLQSRMFFEPGNGLENAAKQAAKAAEKSARAAESSKEIQNQTKDLIAKIFVKLENMGVSTVGG